MKTEPKAFRPQCNIELVLYAFQLLRLFRLLLTNRTGSTRSDSAKACQKLVFELCVIWFYYKTAHFASTCWYKSVLPSLTELWIANFPSSNEEGEKLSPAKVKKNISRQFIEYRLDILCFWFPITRGFSCPRCVSTQCQGHTATVSPISIENTFWAIQSAFRSLRMHSKRCYTGADVGGGCRGCAAPPRDDLRFSNTTVFCKKKLCGLLVLK